MATTKIGSTGVTFPDATVQASAGATGVPVLNVNTSSGTWTKPATVKAIKVTVIGGGGSTPASPSVVASTGSGGGGGGASINIYPAPSLPGPQPYTVGTAGNTSSFGSAPITVISATGGAVGALTSVPASMAVGGTGGVGSSGSLNVPGSPGQQSYIIASVDTPAPTTLRQTGIGGNSLLGTGGVGGNPTTPSAGTPGLGYGGGAGGSRGASQSGGTGATGVVIVEEFY